MFGVFGDSLHGHTTKTLSPDPKLEREVPVLNIESHIAHLMSAFHHPSK